MRKAMKCKRDLERIHLHGGCQQRRIIAEAMEVEPPDVLQESQLALYLVWGGVSTYICIERPSSIKRGVRVGLPASAS